MSQELLVLKRELWNGEGGTWGRPKGSGGGKESSGDTDMPLHASVSILVREYQEEQNRGWSSAQRLIMEAKQDIDAVKRNVQSGNNAVKTLPAGALADLH